MKNLQSVVYQSGNDTTRHPGAGNGSDEDEDDERWCGATHIVHHGILQLLPLATVKAHCYGGADSRSGDE